MSEAKIKFESINFKFPLSNEAIQSQIMMAFIEYLKLNYDMCNNKFNSDNKKISFS